MFKLVMYAQRTEIASNVCVKIASKETKIIHLQNLEATYGGRLLRPRTNGGPTYFPLNTIFVSIHLLNHSNKAQTSQQTPTTPPLVLLLLVPHLSLFVF